MSELPADYSERLNLRDLIARIDRQQEETRKFAAEQHKFSAEAAKLEAETTKLTAEAAKFRRDPWFVLIGAALGAGGAVVGAVLTRLPDILRAMGKGG